MDIEGKSAAEVPDGNSAVVVEGQKAEYVAGASEMG